MDNDRRTCGIGVFGVFRGLFQSERFEDAGMEKRREKSDE